MREYGFSLILILLNKDRIVNSVLIGEIPVGENLYFRIFHKVLEFDIPVYLNYERP